MLRQNQSASGRSGDAGRSRGFMSRLEYWYAFKNLNIYQII